MRALLSVLVLTPFLAAASGGTVEGTVTVKKGAAPGVVKNALVYIDGYKTPAPKEPVTMSQSGRAFQPVVLPIVLGSKVRFSNDELDESLYHHVFTPSKKVLISSPKYKPKEKYDTKEISVPGPFEVFCDIHREMISTVYVVPNDRFTVLATAEGSTATFKIEGITPGTRKVIAWHRTATGPVEQSVEIVEGKTTHVDLVLDGTSNLDKLLNHKRLTMGDYQPLKPDGGSRGEAVGIEDDWK